MSSFPRARAHPLRLVLVADRDADTRMLYRMSLLPTGCDVDEAEDGREVLAKAFGRHPSLIVTETSLDFINGYELCMMLRSDEKTSDVRIIVVTADTHPDQIQRARAAGADAVLIKPCRPEMVLREIRRAMIESQEYRARHAATAGLVNSTSQAADLSTRSLPAARTFRRFETTHPSLPPPVLTCPSCIGMLQYERSHIGGVNDHHSEQWDYFVCPSCGPFQYRQRTRKLRRVG